MNFKKNKKRELGPILTIMVITTTIMFLSFLLSFINFTTHETFINGVNLETKLINVKNIFSAEGIRFFFGNILSAFNMLEPLLLTIISVIGLGIAEQSGLFKDVFKNIKKKRPYAITFLTIFISIVATFFGDHAYAFLLPLSAIIYKYAGRNARLGIITSFIGVSIGMGAGLLFNNTDLLLGTMTQMSASLKIDKSYVYNLVSNLYIMIASTIVLSIIGTIIIDNTISKHYTKKTPLEDEHLNLSKKAFRASILTIIILLTIILYMIIPSLPGSGILLNPNKKVYMEQLMAKDAPFYESIGYLITVVLMIASFIYGKISGNIKNSNEYSVRIADSFDRFGYLFTLLFFTSQMIAILDWTNLGNVFAGLLISFLGSIEMSGVLLVISFFIICILIGIFIPDTVKKWEIISPVGIPLLMKSNITPDFAQFIFTASDGISRLFTPFFSFFIVMIAFLQKYNYDEDNKITIFGVIKSMLPASILFAVVWLLILLAWYIIGLPLGPNIYTTL